jgi:hypothetical protein
MRTNHVLSRDARLPRDGRPANSSSGECGLWLDPSISFPTFLSRLLEW